MHLPYFHVCKDFSTTSFSLLLIPFCLHLCLLLQFIVVLLRIAALSAATSLSHGYTPNILVSIWKYGVLVYILYWICGFGAGRPIASVHFSTCCSENLYKEGYSTFVDVAIAIMKRVIIWSRRLNKHQHYTIPSLYLS